MKEKWRSKRVKLASIWEILVGDSRERDGRKYILTLKQNGRQRKILTQTTKHQTSGRVFRRLAGESFYLIRQKWLISELLEVSKSSLREDTIHRKQGGYFSYFCCVVVWENVTADWIVLRWLIVLHNCLEESLIWSFIIHMCTSCTMSFKYCLILLVQEHEHVWLKYSINWTPLLSIWKAI